MKVTFMGLPRHAHRDREGNGLTSGRDLATCGRDLGDFRGGGLLHGVVRSGTLRLVGKALANRVLARAGQPEGSAGRGMRGVRGPAGPLARAVLAEDQDMY